MDYVIHLCVHCGEYCRGKYCSKCSTAAGRAQIDNENKKIREENIKKGFHYRELVIK